MMPLLLHLAQDGVDQLAGVAPDAGALAGGGGVVNGDAHG
jgi:hypothetical protein